jgi:Flp pilus assembly protein TadD
MPVQHVRAARFLALAALAAVLALAAAGCTTTSGDITGSIGNASEPRTDADWRRSATVWGERYRANNADAEAAANYAQALRATGQRAQAVAVLEQATIENPKDQKPLDAYGRALADVGNYGQALEVLGRAHTPDNPDWRILNVQGAVLDQLGRHLEARRYYATPLKIVPNKPSGLSNLGLSYALNKELKRAETIWRLAVTQPGAEPKVRQNLGLVVGLQGRFEEAEAIVRSDLRG